MAVLAFSVAALAIVVWGAAARSALVLVCGAVLSAFGLVCSLMFLLIGRGRKS